MARREGADGDGGIRRTPSWRLRAASLRRIPCLYGHRRGELSPDRRYFSGEAAGRRLTFVLGLRADTNDVTSVLAGMETGDARALLALTDAVWGNDPGRESFSTRSELVRAHRRPLSPFKCCNPMPFDSSLSTHAHAPSWPVPAASSQGGVSELRAARVLLFPLFYHLWPGRIRQKLGGRSTNSARTSSFCPSDAGGRSSLVP